MTVIGKAWRLSPGSNSSEKITSFIRYLPLMLQRPLPSLHILDLLFGICSGAILRIAVYLKSKDAKKYRHNVEYGSARWGTKKDISPFVAPSFEDNIILTKTEMLMMSNRPKNPANARWGKVYRFFRSKHKKSCRAAYTQLYRTTDFIPGREISKNSIHYQSISHV